MHLIVSQRNLITYNVVFPEFYDAQKEVVKSCCYGEEKYITLNGSRQIGKSLILVSVSLYWSLNTPDQLTMVVSPTDTQVQQIYSRTIETLKESHKQLVKSSKSSGGNAEIVLYNGSKILYRSAKSEDSLRGHPLNYLLCDEAAYFKENIWTTILAPSLAVRGKKVFFCSTPKGGNYFKRLYIQGLDNIKNYKSFLITCYQNPFADIEFIEEQKRILPKEIFEQEYLGIFTDSASVFKNISELAILNKSIQDKDHPIECVAGIDIAMVKDFTVCVILDAKGNMLDYIRFNKLEMTDAVNTISDFLKQWNPRKTIIETNNQGITFYSMLKEKGIYNLEAFNTTTTSKPILINQLIAAFNKKEVKLLNDESVINEFRDFTYTLSPTGSLKFAASHGNDDIVMAFAFAHRAKNIYSSSQLFIY